jgi:hypothetical protein
MDPKERIDTILRSFNELPLTEQNSTIKLLYETVQKNRAQRVAEIDQESAEIKKSILDIDRHFDRLLNIKHDACA